MTDRYQVRILQPLASVVADFRDPVPLNFDRRQQDKDKNHCAEKALDELSQKRLKYT